MPAPLTLSAKSDGTKLRTGGASRHLERRGEDVIWLTDSSSNLHIRNDQTRGHNQVIVNAHAES